MNYIHERTGADIYYDPKELDKAEIPRKFGEAVRWIEKKNAWSLTKTGLELLQSQETSITFFRVKRPKLRGCV